MLATVFLFNSLEIDILIPYIYDATGVKLEKEVNDSGQSTTDYTYYVGNYVYNKPDGQSTKLLTFFNTEEGYIEPVLDTANNNRIIGFEYTYQY